MSVADRAVEWALRIARDDSHGYDQGLRWGPDYDCSSLIISAYKQAGVPLTCTYTGDMRRDTRTILYYGLPRFSSRFGIIRGFGGKPALAPRRPRW